MDAGKSILLLAGSAEARQIGAALVERGLTVRALMSEAPKGPNPMPVPFEVMNEVTADAIDAAVGDACAVVNASHGFDRAMTEEGHAVARARGLPIVSLRRPGWQVSGRRGRHSAADVAAAMRLIEPGARVFCATGWGSMPDFEDFPGERLFLRQTIAHDRTPPFDFVDVVFGTPPFSVASETALFRELSIDTLLCRNLGGRPSRPKLDAAEALGLKIILIDRPPMPKDAVVVNDVPAVLSWVDGL